MRQHWSSRRHRTSTLGGCPRLRDADLARLPGAAACRSVCAFGVANRRQCDVVARTDPRGSGWVCGDVHADVWRWCHGRDRPAGVDNRASRVAEAVGSDVGALGQVGGRSVPCSARRTPADASPAAERSAGSRGAGATIPIGRAPIGATGTRAQTPTRMGVSWVAASSKASRSACSGSGATGAVGSSRRSP